MKKLLIMIIIQFFVFVAQAQNCNQGSQKKIPEKPIALDSTPSAEENTQVYTPIDPNEIIGTRGYDLGRHAAMGGGNGFFALYHLFRERPGVGCRRAEGGSENSNKL